jgi:hypothetical protein
MQRWIEPAMWVGILWRSDLVGLVIRKGVFDYNASRCCVYINDVRVETKQITIAGRTLHCVSLAAIGHLLPADAIWALGWTDDGSTYAFNHRGAPAALCDSARKGFSGGLKMLPAAKWRSEWTEKLYRNPGYSPFSDEIVMSRTPVNRVRRRGETCRNM